MDLKKYEKVLNDFEVQEKISDAFVSVAKCIGYTLVDENKSDVTEEIIKDEIGMERIDTEAITLSVLRELEKWINN